MEQAEELRNVLWAFAAIATGGLLFGYMIGINSNIVTEGQLLCRKDHAGPPGSWNSWGYNQCYELGSLGMGFLSSLNLIGACISSLWCFRYADRIGRKLEAQIAGVLYWFGATVAAVSPILWGIFLGFFIYGLGIGFAMHAAPVYIAEISPTTIRGTLVSAKEAVIVLGIFLGFLAGYAFSGTGSQGWRIMVICSAKLGLAMLVGVSGVPQSPRFLILRALHCSSTDQAEDELYEEASKALQFFRRSSAAGVREELETMTQELRTSLEEDDGEHQGLVGDTGGKGQRQFGLPEAFRYPRPLAVGCGIVLLQQVTGQPSILYYATNIFKSAGFTKTAAIQSAGVGLVKLVATLFTVWRVDDYGRRRLLFVGISMMAVALVLLGIGFRFTECREPGTAVSACNPDDVFLPQSWAVLTVVALMLYVSGYQVGFGPIAWLIISEVFPLKVRGSGLSVAAMVNFGSNIMMTLCTGLLMDALTPSGLFFAFLALSLASLVFVAACVPETKGRSLEEIEALMRS